MPPMQFSISDSLKGHMRSYDEVMMSIYTFCMPIGYNFRLDWVIRHGVEPKCEVIILSRRMLCHITYEGHFVT